ncbi:hypothetical protein SELMODRAFT_419299 [Selaginella moellendorffii]|uniref:Uncharacterized protein n=1 Tax=Selaginella moellendorffii TaxID=88036 RepID=D8S8G9_SELML|nr:hypothetical protein SELMODRAFT_419299 [Selaginella moellendorffii]
MEGKVEQALRRPTPFQVFVRELKQKKVEMTSTVIALMCIVFSSKLVSLKNERNAFDSEHEERMENLREDNRKLREKLGAVSERVMQEASKQQGRKIEPLSTRIDAIFEELNLVPSAGSAAATATTDPSKGTMFLKPSRWRFRPIGKQNQTSFHTIVLSAILPERGTEKRKMDSPLADIGLPRIPSRPGEMRGTSRKSPSPPLESAHKSAKCQEQA